MLLSPLQLNRYFFQELAFKHDDDFNADNFVDEPLPSEALQVSVTRGVNPEDARDWFCRLSVELPPSKGRFSCSLRAVVAGFFTVGGECPDERVQTLVDVNAPALLYGVAREALAALSGRGPLPPLCLPSVTFIDAIAPQGKPQEPKTATTRRKTSSEPTAKTKTLKPKTKS